MYRRILLAADGSYEMDRAFNAALELAILFKAELHMLLVEELPLFPTTVTEVKGEKQRFDRRLAPVVAAAQRRAEQAGLTLGAHVIGGRFVERAMDFVLANSIDLLVLPISRHSSLYDLVFGNAAGRLISIVHCDVHVVQEGVSHPRKRLGLKALSPYREFAL